MSVIVYITPVYRVYLVRDSSEPVPNRRIDEPKMAAEIIAFYLRGEDRENYVALLLDANRCVIGITTVAIGSVDHTVVHPREVFKAALLADAHAIIIGHNHPAGITSPSPHDIRTTQQLVKAGHLLQIPVLDHVIVQPDGVFFSFAEKGLIEEWADED